MADTLDIKTADGKIVHEGDRVYSHYTCTYGTIENVSQAFGNEDPWFDFVQDDGRKHLLNGDRITTRKPEWMR